MGLKLDQLVSPVVDFGILLIVVIKNSILLQGWFGHHHVCLRLHGEIRNFFLALDLSAYQRQVRACVSACFLNNVFAAQPWMNNYQCFV